MRHEVHSRNKRLHDIYTPHSHQSVYIRLNFYRDQQVKSNARLCEDKARKTEYIYIRDRNENIVLLRYSLVLIITLFAVPAGCGGDSKADLNVASLRKVCALSSFLLMGVCRKIKMWGAEQCGRKIKAGPILRRAHFLTNHNTLGRSSE